MKIGIIGATGMAGKRLVAEGIKRGHEITAIVRNENKAKEVLGAEARLLVKDVFLLEKSDLDQFDVVVNAFATDPGHAYQHVDVVAKLVAMFREVEQPRLFFILGAGSLLDENNELFLKTLETIPEASAWISIPKEAYKALLFLQNTENVNWVGVSPSADFIDGDAGSYQLGTDHLLVSKSGKSVITSGTMAVAIFDEIESPQFIKRRFTACES